jgi:antitoxin CptB
MVSPFDGGISLPPVLGSVPGSFKQEGAAMQETAEARLKRMTMRSWRRGMKEMDLTLGPFAAAHLAGFTGAELDAFDALLAENDQDLMAWILGQADPPAALAPLLLQITAFAQARLTPGKSSVF